MLVSNIGEFGLIERIRRIAPADRSVIQGIGDDCAVLPYTRGAYLLYTCDMLVEGVDFKSSDDPALVGRKSLAVSLSDIASCGGVPRWCLVTIGLPKRSRVAQVEALGLRRGLMAWQRQCARSWLDTADARVAPHRWAGHTLVVTVTGSGSSSPTSAQS